MKILICGDSFSCDNKNTWVETLKNNYDLTVLSRPGIGEYKILKQLESADKNYNLFIVSHTSPYRIHMKKHPFYDSGSHKNSDLVLNDVFSRSVFNFKKLCIDSFLKNHFDNEYYETLYFLFREKINSILNDKAYISLSNHPNLDQFVIEKNHIDMSDVWKNYPGALNHYSKQGNDIVYQRITNVIRQLTSK